MIWAVADDAGQDVTGRVKVALYLRSSRLEFNSVALCPSSESRTAHRKTRNKRSM